MSTEENKKPTITELVASLTGYDEIAIQQHFGINPYVDFESSPNLLMRSMAFVLFTREGKSPAEAKKEAMEMPVKSIEKFFAPEPEEVDENEPETEEGKDS